MSSKVETGNGEPKRGHKPWSTPRVILAGLHSTDHQVGKAPSDKINSVVDQITPSGSSGS
jgi:hypothetical protein